MDPLAQAMQMLQEAQQVLVMQAEEIQALRQQIQKPQQGMQKKASLNNLSAIVGMREEELPDFVKSANENEVRDFMSAIELRTRHTIIGKVAEINDGVQSDNPAEQLEATLAGLLG
jgi:predicted house-cleaning noncanonical NTP pyrophosphatase (MazG superfamily)